jgi:putative multiple sugar transport system ATP-binding protein
VIDWRETNKRTEELLAKVGLVEAPTTKVDSIGVGKQQLVEIAKALSKDVKLLILDEPTAALQENDSRKLLDLMLELKAQGVTSIIISHKLGEVRYVADTVTVIRDGTDGLHARCDEGLSEDRIVRDMVGRDMTHRFPEHAARPAKSCWRSRTGTSGTRSTPSGRSSGTRPSTCAPARSSGSPG